MEGSKIRFEEINYPIKSGTVMWVETWELWVLSLPVEVSVWSFEVQNCKMFIGCWIAYYVSMVELGSKDCSLLFGDLSAREYPVNYIFIRKWLMRYI